MNLMDYLIEHHSDPGRTQTIFKFPNNYGASIIRDAWKPAAMFELAVIEFPPTEKSWKLAYDTHITDDIMPGLALHEIEPLLLEIYNLWPRAKREEWEKHA